MQLEDSSLDTLVGCNRGKNNNNDWFGFFLVRSSSEGKHYISSFVSGKPNKCKKEKIFTGLLYKFLLNFTVISDVCKSSMDFKAPRAGQCYNEWSIIYGKPVNTGIGYNQISVCWYDETYTREAVGMRNLAFSPNLNVSGNYQGHHFDDIASCGGLPDSNQVLPSVGSSISSFTTRHGSFVDQGPALILYMLN